MLGDSTAAEGERHETVGMFGYVRSGLRSQRSEPSRHRAKEWADPCSIVLDESVHESRPTRGCWYGPQDSLSVFVTLSVLGATSLAGAVPAVARIHGQPDCAGDRPSGWRGSEGRGARRVGTGCSDFTSLGKSELRDLPIGRYRVTASPSVSSRHQSASAGRLSVARTIPERSEPDGALVNDVHASGQRPRFDPVVLSRRCAP